MELQRSLYDLFSRQAVVSVRSDGIIHIGILKNISSKNLILTIAIPQGAKVINFENIQSIVEHK